MIHHILKERLIFLFIKGLTKLLRWMIKVSHPWTMDDSIRDTYNLEPTMKSLKGGSLSSPKVSHGDQVCLIWDRQRMFDSRAAANIHRFQHSLNSKIDQHP